VKSRDCIIEITEVILPRKPSFKRKKGKARRSEILHDKNYQNIVVFRSIDFRWQTGCIDLDPLRAVTSRIPYINLFDAADSERIEQMVLTI
jgi:hypothetical protein